MATIGFERWLPGLHLVRPRCWERAVEPDSASNFWQDDLDLIHLRTKRKACIDDYDAHDQVVRELYRMISRGGRGLRLHLGPNQRVYRYRSALWRESRTTRRTTPTSIHGGHTCTGPVAQWTTRFRSLDAPRTGPSSSRSRSQHGTMRAWTGPGCAATRVYRLRRGLPNRRRRDPGRREPGHTLRLPSAAQRWTTAPSTSPTIRRSSTHLTACKVFTPHMNMPRAANAQM
jgi:hypothetical protein